MSEDKYGNIRNLPFDLVARALGIDMSKFRERKGGTEFAGPCPVHAPKKNGTAFSYSTDGKWHCFSCQAKGKGSIDLTMAVRGLGFQDAVSLLEPYAATAAVGVVTKRPEIKQVQVVLPSENQPFKGTYEKFFKPHHPWLAERGLTPATLEHFGVGFYQNESRRSVYTGSVMLRISRYSDGECVGYLSRNIGDITPEKPKYRFPEGLHKGLELFGAWQLKCDHKLPLRVIYLVESPFAVMAFHQKGLPAVSPFGWSLADQQIAIVAELAKGVVCLPDTDKAEAFAPYAHALSKRVWARCPSMPKGVVDPEYLTLEQIRALT